jgi:hypothetical protein
MIHVQSYRRRILKKADWCETAVNLVNPFPPWKEEEDQEERLGVRCATTKVGAARTMKRPPLPALPNDLRRRKADVVVG